MSDKPQFNESYWQDHYQENHRPLDANNLLISPYLNLGEIANLPPGKALDAGCGEGADAVWLAKRGWEVKAVDISAIALTRARETANAAGIPVDFEQADLTTWVPEKNTYDLVISQYVHTTDNDKAITNLAEAVKPSGILLIAGHAPHEGHSHNHHDENSHSHHNQHAEGHSHGQHAEGSHVTTGEISAGLDPAEWEVLIAEPRTTERNTPDGKTVVLHDSLLVARKR